AARHTGEGEPADGRDGRAAADYAARARRGPEDPGEGPDDAPGAAGGGAPAAEPPLVAAIEDEREVRRHEGRHHEKAREVGRVDGEAPLREAVGAVSREADDRRTGQGVDHLNERHARG